MSKLSKRSRRCFRCDEGLHRLFVHNGEGNNILKIEVVFPCGEYSKAELEAEIREIAEELINEL